MLGAEQYREALVQHQFTQGFNDEEKALLRCLGLSNEQLLAFHFFLVVAH
jgi:hypothetical protein